MILRSETHKRYTALFVALILLCWALLAAWSASPWALYLDHDALEHVGSAGAYAPMLALFVLGWVLMVAAMMLPTSLPLITLFARLVANRPARGRLLALLIGGYLAIWIAFGVAAHAGDLALHEVVHRVPWLHENVWVVGAGVFLVAGLFQFSALKYACLDACRSPMSFVAAHWQGSSEARAAWTLGVRHGLFCVGCCWALMLLMFATASANLAWMLALGAVMAVEKNAPWGRRISAPLGVLLIGAAVVVTVVGMQSGHHH